MSENIEKMLQVVRDRGNFKVAIETTEKNCRLQSLLLGHCGYSWSGNDKKVYTWPIYSLVCENGQLTYFARQRNHNKHIADHSFNVDELTAALEHGIQQGYDFKEPEPTPENTVAGTANPAVFQPKHYELFPDIESIEIIACSLTLDEWRGFCLGNCIKYRLRAGKKDKLEQDIGKANNYANNLFNDFKHLCRGPR